MSIESAMSTAAAWRLELMFRTKRPQRRPLSGILTAPMHPFYLLSCSLPEPSALTALLFRYGNHRMQLWVMVTNRVNANSIRPSGEVEQTATSFASVAPVAPVAPVARLSTGVRLSQR
jgi:hypothetical protein